MVTVQKLVTGTAEWGGAGGGYDIYTFQPENIQ